VKRITRRKIAAQRRKILRRLKAALELDGERPVITASNIHYEIADRTRAISHGGIGVIHLLVNKVGLPVLIDDKLKLLKQHRPYHESDHVLNIAYNSLCGGRVLEDIELRRNDEVFLDALGAKSIPDPTTAGDFCRRFEPSDIYALMDAGNEARLKVWQHQPASFTEETARIDADGTYVSTLGECKEGMDISRNGVWGYHPLLVSLANTQEPLYLLNRSANRPSHEGVIPLYDKAVELCRRGGFKDILLRGDTDFSLTTEFDRWDDDDVRFVFGYDAKPNLKNLADWTPESEYQELVRYAERAIQTEPRERPENVKERIVVEREFENIKLLSEQVVEFEYTPVACERPYRMVAVRKNLSVEKGELALFEEIRYFFYVTNDWSMTEEEVVREATQRCNQENLNAQLKDGGVRALHAPVNTLNANWAYMVMSAMAWSFKAWVALMLPIHGRWLEKHIGERDLLLRMEYRTFYNTFIAIPAQIIKTGRRIVYRLLAWNPHQHILFRLFASLRE
jgi:hypothetical protein